jgi:3-deoxy-7-phosphoheptulonate synthase
MIIVMEPGAPEEQIQDVVRRLEHYGFRIILNRGDVMTVVAAIGDKRLVQTESIASMPGVRQILPIREPYKLAGRESQPHDTVIDLGHDVFIGSGKPLVIMAGPCSVEDNLEGLLKVARAVKKDGAQVLRGGAFKPRTSPYDFQGLEEIGLQYLAKAREETGLLIVTEVMDSLDVQLVADYADILQIGARNMQNFKLLKAVGKIDKPVLLKRGPSATIREFLLAAEHIMYQGNNRVVLCERGVKGLDSSFARNTLDLSAIPIIKKYSHLPIISDPSHGTGRRYLIDPMAKASIAAGADGLMIEVHHDPDKAYSDGAQSLTIEEFDTMMKELKRLEEVLRPVNAV